MKSSLFAIAALSLLLILSVPLYSQVSDLPPSKNRIIRADRPDVREDQDDESAPAIEIVYVSVGNRNVEINEAFNSDDKWLSDLRIGIRNISPRTITCVGIAFRVLAEIDTKLKTNESWRWGLSFYRGDCGRDQKSSGKLRLAPGEQAVLDETDIPRSYGDMLKKMSSLAKAVFHENTWIRFEGMKPVELPLAFSKSVRFLDDDSY